MTIFSLSMACNTLLCSQLGHLCCAALRVRVSLSLSPSLLFSLSAVCCLLSPVACPLLCLLFSFCCCCCCSLSLSLFLSHCCCCLSFLFSLWLLVLLSVHRALSTLLFDNNWHAIQHPPTTLPYPAWLPYPLWLPYPYLRPVVSTAHTRVKVAGDIQFIGSSSGVECRYPV